MCGIFGFIATSSGDGADAEILQRLATANEPRGPHAFGFAHVDADGRLRSFKRPGRPTTMLDRLDAAHGSRVVVGHTRWATNGDPADNRNNHPHRMGRGFYVHNGTIPHFEQLADDYGLEPRTDCDSEVIGLIAELQDGTLAERLKATLDAIDANMTAMGILPAGRGAYRFFAIRRVRPLWFSKTDNGLYFSSVPDALPGDASPMRDRQVWTRNVARHVTPPPRPRRKAAKRPARKADKPRRAGRTIRPVPGANVASILADLPGYQQKRFGFAKDSD